MQTTRAAAQCSTPRIMAHNLHHQLACISPPRAHSRRHSTRAPTTRLNLALPMLSLANSSYIYKKSKQPPRLSDPPTVTSTHPYVSSPTPTHSYINNPHALACNPTTTATTTCNLTPMSLTDKHLHPDTNTHTTSKT